MFQVLCRLNGRRKGRREMIDLRRVRVLAERNRSLAGRSSQFVAFADRHGLPRVAEIRRFLELMRGILDGTYADRVVIDPKWSVAKALRSIPTDLRDNRLWDTMFSDTHGNANFFKEVARFFRARIMRDMLSGILNNAQSLHRRDQEIKSMRQRVRGRVSDRRLELESDLDRVLKLLEEHIGASLRTHQEVKARLGPAARSPRH
jgi:hypothetical protein